MNLIDAHQLVLGYEWQAVVGPIDFMVDEGDYLCIVGDNGAGKSTLVKAMLSLIGPMSGSLDFHMPPASIGYLPQSPTGLGSFPTSVEEVVCSGAVGRLGRRFFLSKKDREEAVANLDRMGVADLRKRSFNALSGGQRQRVLLARALTAASRILLLDEPVAGLDIHTSSELYGLIDRLNKEGMTIIMVTHDIHPALNSATRILHLGHSSFFGTPADYFESEEGRTYLKEAGHND